MKLCSLHEAKEEKDWVGIFIPLPSRLAKQFPHKKEDSSKAHITMLYIGEVGKLVYDNVVSVVKSVVRSVPSFKIEMEDYGEFENKEGDTIAHMIPRSETSLETLHQKLRKACERRHIQVDHFSGPFKPHITLKYIKGNQKYKGPRPTGSWTVQALEVWSDKFGNTKIPLK